ncbi:uncharacterized protein LOC127277550 [Leptopilina boulardi]|uniref:uncharacterized protein LOC127277550 n=1 Tax=Leptopilina boulardi TaxID=63433 RepID=UPI0021F5E01B|nr:uncharacterized protein LOC127277550 [Leptopilina boulardi]
MTRLILFLCATFFISSIYGKSVEEQIKKLKNDSFSKLERVIQKFDEAKNELNEEIGKNKLELEEGINRKFKLANNQYTKIIEEVKYQTSHFEDCAKLTDIIEKEIPNELNEYSTCLKGLNKLHEITIQYVNYSLNTILEQINKIHVEATICVRDSKNDYSALGSGTCLNKILDDTEQLEYWYKSSVPIKKTLYRNSYIETYNRLPTLCSISIKDSTTIVNQVHSCLVDDRIEDLS